MIQKNAAIDQTAKKVLWAVDAFPSHPELQLRTVHAAKALLDSISSSVEPVYVFRPAPPGLFTQPPHAIESSAVDRAKEQVTRVISAARWDRVTSPKFLVAENNSAGSVVKRLLEHAQEYDFQLIVAATHGRKGPARFFMGSIAELLVQMSPVPVLLIPPKAGAKSTSNAKHILFATDFCEKSHETFRAAVNIARSSRADIILFHHLQFITPDLAFPFVVPPLSPKLLDQIREERRAQASSWVAYGASHEVNVRFHLCEHRGETAEQILRAARKLPDSIIALASQSGRVESTLLGSVARKVVRASPCPVLLLHPQSRRDQWLGLAPEILPAVGTLG